MVRFFFKEESVAMMLLWHWIKTFWIPSLMRQHNQMSPARSTKMPPTQYLGGCSGGMCRRESSPPLKLTSRHPNTWPDDERIQFIMYNIPAPEQKKAPNSERGPHGTTLITTARCSIAHRSRWEIGRSRKDAAWNSTAIGAINRPIMRIFQKIMDGAEGLFVAVQWWCKPLLSPRQHQSRWYDKHQKNATGVINIWHNVEDRKWPVCVFAQY